MERVAVGVVMEDALDGFIGGVKDNIEEEEEEEVNVIDDDEVKDEEDVEGGV